MKKGPWLAAAGFILWASLALAQEALLAPGQLLVDGIGPRFQWKPVPGAGAYRVAILDQPAKDGSRETLAAVWVRSPYWGYGPDGVLPKLGKLPSTPLKPLPQGRKLKVMVAAAREDGSERGPWASAELELGIFKPRPQRETVLEIEIGEKWAGPDEE